MKKQLKPVVTSVMVLALGFSIAACGQNGTVHQKSMTAKNEMHRMENKMVPHGTNMNNRDMGYMDNRMNNVDPLTNTYTDNTYTNNMNRTDGYTNKMDTRMNNTHSAQNTNQIANRAKQVSGVKKATVVVHNKDCIVGIDVDNTGKKAIIEKQVYAALKGQYPAYKFHVTSDQGMHQRIQSMNGNMTDGHHPIKTFGNDVNMMIRDIGNALTAPMR